MIEAVVDFQIELKQNNSVDISIIVKQKLASMALLCRTTVNKISQTPRKGGEEEIVRGSMRLNKVRVTTMADQRRVGEGERVEVLRRELHHWILSIEEEGSRNGLLRRMVGVLEGELSVVQAAKRSEEEFASSHFEKRIRKAEYDIKQILHKSNEEIAKINQLKEEAGASRDERVVYSNLFNKIEKQIKREEEIYKHSLIRSEHFLEQEQLSFLLKKSRHELAPSESYQAAEVSQNPVKCSVKDQERKRSQLQNEMFITNIKDTAHGYFQADSQKSSKRQNNLTLNNTIQERIRQKQSKIRRFLKNCQCESVQHAVEYYQAIDAANQTIFDQIDKVETAIQASEEHLKAIRQKTIVCEDGSHVAQARKAKSRRNIFSEQNQLPQSSVRDTILAICNLLQIDTDCENPFHEDVLRQIDSETDGFLSDTCVRSSYRKETNLLQFEEAYHNSNRRVEELLERMERFGESEKILDRAALSSQYQKEIGKARKKLRKAP